MDNKDRTSFVMDNGEELQKVNIEKTIEDEVEKEKEDTEDCDPDLTEGEEYEEKTMQDVLEAKLKKLESRGHPLIGYNVSIEGNPS